MTTWPAPPNVADHSLPGSTAQGGNHAPHRAGSPDAGPLDDLDGRIPSPVIAALFVCGVIAFVVFLAIDRSADAEQDPAGTVTHLDEWDPLLRPYVRFVEQARERSFIETVSVRRADIAAELAEPDDDMGDWTEEEQADFAAAAEAAARVNILLGFVPDSEAPQADAEAAAADVISSSSAAYYDTSASEIVIPDGDVDPWLASVIVHELTHALQDQHRLLDHGGWTADEALMQRALVEGDADRIEWAWIQAQDEATQQAIFDVYDSFDPVPTSFHDIEFAAPYVLGDPLIEGLIAGGGQHAVDVLLLKGAGSTERLLAPDSPTPSPGLAEVRWIDDKDLDVISGGTLGALQLYQLLAPGLGHERSLNAVVGYDLDDYVVHVQDGEFCARVVVWTDGPSDSVELADALTAIGARPIIADRGVPAATSVGFTRCESDGPLTDPAQQSMELIDPLAQHLWATTATS